MAKQASDTVHQYEAIRKEILAGEFRPFYLLFGKEHFYIDLLCDLIIERAIPDTDRDFGQFIFYGSDVNANRVVTAARQFPMMIERQLVVVKEAQLMGDLEQIAVYFDAVMPSTILVICYKTPNDPARPSGRNIDKRTAFYKKGSTIGRVLESNPVPDYRMPAWIEGYFRQQGLSISAEGAALLAEFAGSDMQKIASETDKLIQAMPEGETQVSARMVEANVGMSRDYSVFELTRALSLCDAPKCFRIAGFFAQSGKRYPFPMLMAALSAHFLKLLRLHALLRSGMKRDQALSRMGINPYFAKEYDAALRNYPVKAAMRAISVLKEYDYRSKSPSRGAASDGELLQETVAQLLRPR